MKTNQTEWKRWRILTRQQWREHRAKHFPKAKGWSAEDRNKAADIAATNSNYMHNSKTGFQEFAKDTPAWILRIAKCRNWISKRGELQWE